MTPPPAGSRGADSGSSAWSPPILLAVAMLAGAALILWINRGSFLFFDEVLWFADMGDRDGVLSILHPHNNHLIGAARSLFLLLGSTIGVEYVVLRVVAVIGVLLVAALFFAYARRRVGDWIALFPSLLLIVYGSAWQHVVSPIGLTITFSIAAGLGALLALERNDRRGDVLACLLACASIFTYTIGLSYLVGIAVSVLLRADRWRRSWIFLLPLLLYVPWWLWARQFSDGRVSADNLIDAPIYAAKSLANVVGALTGLAIPFSRFGEGAAGIASAPGGVLGVLVGVAVIVAIAWRLSRGSIPPSLWMSLAIIATYWLMSAIADTPEYGSQVNAVRYILPGSVALLLVLVDAAKGCEIRRWMVWTVAGVFAFSLVMNAYFLRDGARFVRDAGAATEANLAMIELAGDLDPGRSAGEGGTPGAVMLPEGGSLPSLVFPPDPKRYLAAVEKYGSPTFTLDRLRAQRPPVRALADGSLIALERIAVMPGADPPTRSIRRRACVTLQPGTEPVPLPEEGALLRAAETEDVTVSLRRFSDDPGVAVGTAAPDSWSALSAPTDGSDVPWLVSAPSTGELRICPLGGR